MSESTQAGTRIKSFMRDLAMCRESFYNLDPRPLSVKIGRATIVVESAKEYVERLRTMQDEQAAAAALCEDQARLSRARRG
jgi:hypothetical protein